MKHPVVIRSRRAITPEGVVPADVVLEVERIAAVEAHGSVDGLVTDLGDEVLMAGMVDVHVHVNEPGRTHWEGFDSATRSAAAGGTTTLVDMPLNSSPVTTSAQALSVKRSSARGSCWVDVGFHGGVVPGNAGAQTVLDELSGSGVLAAKAFLCHSGLAEFPAVEREHLEAAMPVLARNDLRLFVHAELFDAGSAKPVSDQQELRRARPPEVECRAIELLVELCRATGCAVHVVHLSAADALPMLAAARDEGLDISVETCPHYLYFDAEHIPDADARFKCAPPIRDAANRERLWQGLQEGIIDFISSDHSPCPPSMKPTSSGGFGDAWGGISSLQLTLPVVWTTARERGIGVEQLSLWLSTRPADLLGLHDRGRIAPGALASLVAWNPDAAFEVDTGALFHRHATTPYADSRLHGIVERCWHRGREVYGDGRILGPPRGELLTRGTAS